MSGLSDWVYWKDTEAYGLLLKYRQRVSTWKSVDVRYREGNVRMRMAALHASVNRALEHNPYIVHTQKLDDLNRRFEGFIKYDIVFDYTASPDVRVAAVSRLRALFEDYLRLMFMAGVGTVTISTFKEKFDESANYFADEWGAIIDRYDTIIGCEEWAFSSLSTGDSARACWYLKEGIESFDA